MADIRVVKGTNPEYRDCLRLLSKACLDVSMRHKSSPVYKNLCDWILSSDILRLWIGAANPILSDLSAGMQHQSKTGSEEPSSGDMEARNTVPKRSLQSVARSIQTLEVKGSIQDTAILAGSLVSSLQGQRRENGDLFISLIHRHPQPLPLTKMQLMACICHQLLSNQARRFNDIRPFVKEIVDALETNNLAWKEAAIWRLLKSLLGNHVLGQVFIIIHQPENGTYASPFRELVSDLCSLVDSTEISCKILIVRKAYSDDGPSENRAIVSLRDISYDNQTAQAKLHMDYEAEFEHICRRNLRFSALKENVMGFLKRRSTDLLMTRLWFAIVEQHISLPLQSVERHLFPGSTGEFVSLILDLIPKAVQPWVKAGLIWITYGARPMTCSELAATMSGGPENLDSAQIPLICAEFQNLLCGLVEIDGNAVYLASSGVAEQLAAAMTGPDDRKVTDSGRNNRDNGNHENNKQMDDEKEMEERNGWNQRPWCASESHQHLMIARKCVEYLRMHYDNVNGSKAQPSSERSVNPKLLAEDSTPVVEVSNEQESSNAVPSLSYAAEYWFTHVQIWIKDIQKATDKPSEASGEQKPEIPEIPYFVVEFLGNDGLVHHWLKMRNTRPDSDNPVPDQKLCDLGTDLGLDLTNADELSKLVVAMQRVSEIQLEDEPTKSFSHSLAVALCQLEYDKMLDELVKKGHFEDESTLTAAFRIGSDSALCHLADTYPTFVRQNLPMVVHNAIRLGSQNLLRKVAAIGDQDDMSSPQEYDRPVFHFIAELGSILPDEILWDRFKSHVCHTDTTGDMRTALHLAAISGHYVLIPMLLKALNINVKDSSGATPLFYAAKYGHYTIAGQLLAAGANSSTPRKDKQSPLHIASAKGRVDIVTLLLDHEAKRDIKDCRLNTPLHLALENHHEEITLALLRESKQLLSRDLAGSADIAIHDHALTKEGQGEASTPAAVEVDPSGANQAKITQSHAAEPRGDNSYSSPSPSETRPTTVAVSPKPEAGARTEEKRTSYDVAARNSAEMTPLILATKGNHAKVITVLLGRGANPNVADKRGRVPLHYAAEASDPELFDQLIMMKDIEIDISDADGNTPLHLASARGHVGIMEKLLKKEASNNVQNKLRLSPLELACERGRTKAVRALLAACSPSIRTAGFLKAAAARNLDAVNLLLDAGADMNATTSSGNTALHHSAFNSDAKVVQAFLTRRAQLNPLDARGRTPLIDAASQNAVECVKMLVDAGADVDVRDDEGITALFEAAKGGHKRCVEILLGANAVHYVPGDPLCTEDAFLEVALAQFKTDVFRLVMEHITHEHRRCDVSNNALLQFLQEDDCDVEKIRVLLDNGLDLNKVIGDYGTILHYAALWDNLELAKLLTEPGRKIDLNPISEAHGTPLQIAAQKAKYHGVEIVSLLLEKGANTRLGSGYYGSPLHAAVRTGECWEHDITIVELLLKYDPGALHVLAGPFPTVLQAVVQGGTTEMLDLLLKYKPKFDVVVGTWGTPLHLAARRGYRIERNMLLKAGFPHLTRTTLDIGGRIPLDLAVIDGNLDGVKALSREESPATKTDATTHQGESSATKTDDPRPVEHLATRTDKQGRHVLHFCAGQGNHRIAGWMLSEHPETINDKDVDGWTPLHWACRRKSAQVIELLIERGAEKNDRTKRGWKPIDVAKYHGGDSEIMDLVRSESSDDFVQGHGDPAVDEEERPNPETQERARCLCDSCYCVRVPTPKNPLLSKSH